MQQLLTLQPGDDMPALQHQLEGAQARRVAVVIPRECTMLRSPINARLLRRLAADLALDVALVTRDARTRQAAREEGLAVVGMAQRGVGGQWRSGVPRRSSAQQAAAARVERLRMGRKDRGYSDTWIRWAGRVVGALLLLVLLAAVIGVAALAVPEARITVVPFRESVDASLELRADPEVEKASLEDLVIPARLIQLTMTETGQIDTVGKKDAPDQPARGAIVFTNEVATAHEILPGVIVRTSTGTTVRFQTVTTATLDARVGARAVAEVEALEPGPVGNVDAATINAVETAAWRGKVRVINEKATSGGGVKQVGVVTRADMDRLRGQLLQQLQQDAFDRLSGLAEDHEFLPPESMTIEILSEVYDQFLDAEADVLSMQMAVFAVGTAVDETNARLLAEEAVKAEIPSTYELHSEAIAYHREEGVRMDGRAVILRASASAPLISDVKAPQVRSLARGLSEEEAVGRLYEELALAQPPIVQVGPAWIKRWDWLNRVPRLSFRIQVLVKK